MCTLAARREQLERRTLQRTVALLLRRLLRRLLRPARPLLAGSSDVGRRNLSNPLPCSGDG